MDISLTTITPQKSNATALAVALFMGACASDDKKEVDNSFEGAGDPYSDTRRSLGLNYAVDPETGQSTREGDSPFSSGSYFGESGAKSARIGDYKSTESADLLRSKEFGTSTARADGEEADTRKDGFFADTFRFSDRNARQQGKTARFDKSDYGSAKVPVNPYHESKKMMDTESYYSATRDQELGNNRASDQRVRDDRPGDPGVSVRNADDMTVEDVRTLLNKN